MPISRILLDRQVSRVLSFKDTVDVRCRAAVWVHSIRPVGYQASTSDVITQSVNCRQSKAGRECNNRTARSFRRGWAS
jgi:hypothetical protein